MAYDAESDAHYVTTLHDQTLTVSRNDCSCGKCKRLMCIWVGDTSSEQPLAFRRDEDALRLANLLIEAVLEPNEVAPQSGPC